MTSCCDVEISLQVVEDVIVVNNEPDTMLIAEIEQGLPGPQGEKGDQGIQGIQGETGPQGPQQIFVQNSQPTFTNVGLWIQTGLGSTGQDFSIWFEDGQ